MMKWFRKHNKQLLAVFASALLVVWLGGSAIEKLLTRNPFTEPVGSAMGQKINASQFAALKGRLSVMDSLQLPWYAPWVNRSVMEQLRGLGVGSREMQMVMQTMGSGLLTDAGGADRDKGATCWWLLELEARKMGVTVSQQQVIAFLKDHGVTGEILNRIRDSFNLSAEEILDTVAEYLRVSQAAVLASAGVQVSEPEVKDVFVQTHDQLKVQYAILPMQAFEKSAAGTQPTKEAIPESELQSLFEKYRDQLPVKTMEKHEYGYKIPDREVIQYVGGTVDEIAATLPPVSEERARKYFEQKKDQFQPPRPPGTQPTTQPAVTFEQVKDQVVDKIKKQDAATILRQAVEEIRSSAWVEFADAKTDLAAGKVPPTLADVLAKQTEQFKTAKRIPLTYTQTPPVSQEQAGKEPGIGIAGSLDARGRPVDFARVAFDLAKDEGKESAPKTDEKMVQISKYQPVVVRNQAGDQLTSMYVFRVVKFEPSHAPASLAEVRSQVEADAREIQAMKRAEQAARQLAQAAEKTSLKDAFNAQFPAAASQAATTQPYGGAPGEMKLLEVSDLTRMHETPPHMVAYMQKLMMPNTVPGLMLADPFIKACFDLAGPATSTQPVNKITVVELPEQQMWVVANVLEHKPGTQAEFDAQKSTLAAELRLMQLKEFYGDWFKPSNIRERMGWQSAGNVQTD